MPSGGTAGAGVTGRRARRPMGPHGARLRVPGWFGMARAHHPLFHGSGTSSFTPCVCPDLAWSLVAGVIAAWSKHSFSIRRPWCSRCMARKRIHPHTLDMSVTETRNQLESNIIFSESLGSKQEQGFVELETAFLLFLHTISQPI